MTAPAPTELVGTEWVLETLRGAPLVKGSNITLNFEEHASGGFNGYGGCNYYGARYLATETAFSVVYGVESTAMSCDTPAGVMEQEEAYSRALGTVTAYRVRGRIGDNRLEMAEAGGDPVLVFTERGQLPMDPADLVGTRWRLHSVGGDGLSLVANITLAFPRVGELVGTAGCVAYDGTYDAQGNDIHVTMLAADYAACAEDEALQGQGAAYSEYLSTTTDFQLSETELKLFTAPGATLIFKAQP